MKPSPSSPVDPILATVSRSGRVESWHCGALAVHHDDELLLAVGDVGAGVYARSATKPLQALPFFDRGLDRSLALSDGEIAVLCASHEGTEAHVATVRQFLARGGLREEQLGCGPHAPYDAASRRALLLAGGKPLRVHNNCWGKHTGFLHLAAACGDDLAHYLDPGCRSQREVAAAVAAMAGTGPLDVGVDGCGAPTFWLPLRALARGFARLANPNGQPSVRATACRTILHAVGREPVLLAGEGRFCTALVRTLPGRMFAKNGAEGVYAIGVAPDPSRRACPGGLGIAIKIRDGNERGYQPVLVDLLLHLGVFGDGVPDALRPWHVLPLSNTRREPIGEVRCAIDWSRA
ncbi:MAG: asparaginase [Planctomycetes bacterium]|nr:asparaginase [Planctomycetota bacterium]